MLLIVLPAVSAEDALLERLRRGEEQAAGQAQTQKHREIPQPRRAGQRRLDGRRGRVTR